MKDTDAFKEMMRIDFEHFKEILNLIEANNTPQKIAGANKVISAAQCLTLTIRSLATGESFGSLNLQFCISNQAISYILKNVCNVTVK